MTKYVYNNSRHNVTRIFSFENLFEKISRWVNTILDERFNIKTSTIKKRVRKTTKKRAQMKMLLTKVAENQAKYYNLKHISMIYNVDDKVLLNVKNIIFIKSFKKLNYKYYDSYEIIELIKKQVYRLKLSFLLKEIHNVFHVFLLESHLYDSAKALELLSIIEVDDEN
jgi:hydroxymethylpyrimidine pyrophosphatase-like HAD family hydrolase